MIFGKRAANAAELASIQADYEAVFSTAAGRRVFADLAVMWGAFGDAPGVEPQFRNAFLWILDRMGKGHIENAQALADALLSINRVIPEPEASGEDTRTWRKIR